MLQTKYKAVAAAVLGFLSPLLVFYQANQNLTLKQLVAGLVSALVSGVVIHQVPNKVRVAPEASVVVKPDTTQPTG